MRSINMRIASLRLRAAKTPEGIVMSIRCFRRGWDVMATKETFFIQFGGKVVKFLTFGKQPRFMLSPSWRIKRRFKSLKVGTTLRPYNMAPYWRTQDAIWAGTTIRREDGAATRLVNAGRLQQRDNGSHQ